MNLLEYFKAEKGNQARLAKALDVSPSYLSQMASGTVATSPKRGVQIEDATDGAVTRRDTHPDDWWLIWPELVTADHPIPADKAPA